MAPRGGQALARQLDRARGLGGGPPGVAQRAGHLEAAQRQAALLLRHVGGDRAGEGAALAGQPERQGEVGVELAHLARAAQVGAEAARHDRRQRRQRAQRGRARRAASRWAAIARAPASSAIAASTCAESCAAP
jgi:hypothetical protein